MGLRKLMAVRLRADDALWSTTEIVRIHQPSEGAEFAHEWSPGSAVLSLAWRKASSEWMGEDWWGYGPSLLRYTPSHGFSGFGGVGQLFDRVLDASALASQQLPIVVCRRQADITMTGTTADPSAPQPAWIAPVAERLEAIRALPAGWDGGEAKRPDAWHAVEAFGFLWRLMRAATAVPSIVPLADGGVQIEWHRGGLDIEATFTAGPDRGLYFADLSTGYEFEGPVDAGIGELRDLIARLEEANTATTVHAAY